ncbi:MAG TPA: aminotransferase class V-fold PLP-dependent enzyme [Chloroflexota bacterium]|nr:aminotransferase class V-fold PLP-dependent enzyme [Chloroflexota bacterium]
METRRRGLLAKELFVGLEDVAHLCTGGEAPWLRSHDEVCRRFGRLKSGGMAGRDEMFRVYRRAKERVAGMLGIAPERVAFLAHASEGLNLAVAGVDWRQGDNAVFADVEYPSAVYPVARLMERGVEPRVVRTRDHYLSMEDLVAAVDARTRLVLVSHVSYLTGQRVDLAKVAELARSRGALLAVDATHALGVAPVPGDLCDFVVSSCYKWLLATHGVGIFAYAPERVGDLQPNVIGWHSIAGRGGVADPLAMPLQADAARFEAGNPSLLGLFVLDNALATLAPIDRSAVLDHALDLTGELVGGLRARGRTVLTPASRDERAGNVAFLAADAPELAARLSARKVEVWGSERRIRVSAHLYNDADDVARFFDALDAETP